MHCLDIVWLVSPSNHLRAASCFLPAAFICVNTRRAWPPRDTAEMQQIGIQPVAFQEPPSVFHLVSKYFLFGVAYNFHVDMFRIVSSCSHDCCMEKEWAEAFDSSDLAHETFCNLSSKLNHLAVPLYHHHKMLITFSFESRRHLGSHVQSSSTAGIHSKAKIKEHLRYIRGCCSNINM